VLRLVMYFVGTLVLLSVLRQLPWIGGIFQVPLLGFFIAATVLSALIAWWTRTTVDRGRQKRLERSLGAVDTPHNQGKLGSLILAQGRAVRAIPYLERASAGEPDSAQWHYRLGSARLAAKRYQPAAEALARAAAIDEELAYGAVLLRLAEACVRNGDPAAGLEALARFERNHGPSPESAYWRGRALRAQGQHAAGRAAFAEVHALAARAAQFQKRHARVWTFRAFVARFL
jgi:tetratricopeptide (TPR) repeat protein